MILAIYLFWFGFSAIKEGPDLTTNPSNGRRTKRMVQQGIDVENDHLQYGISRPAYWTFCVRMVRQTLLAGSCGIELKSWQVEAGR